MRLSEKHMDFEVRLVASNYLGQVTYIHLFEHLWLFLICTIHWVSAMCWGRGASEIDLESSFTGLSREADTVCFCCERYRIA